MQIPDACSAQASHWNTLIAKAHSAVTLLRKSHNMGWEAHAAVTLRRNLHMMSWNSRIMSVAIEAVEPGCGAVEPGFARTRVM